jgi:hypothetical protein
MTIREAEEFIACVPWRAVKMVEVGDTGKTPDPHEYVIKGWREVDTNLFDAFVRFDQGRGLPGKVSGAVSARVRNDEPIPRDQRLVLLVHPPEHAQPGAGRASEARADPR